MEIEKKISYIALSISNLFSIDRESFHDKQQEMEHTFPRRVYFLNISEI
jgi:hypothetical protein